MVAVKSLGGGVKTLDRRVKSLGSVVEKCLGGGVKSVGRRVKSLGRVMEKSLGGGSKVPVWWSKDHGP